MTGRELIMYILQNGLEDKQIFENNKLIAHLTVEEFAVKYGVGRTSHRTSVDWYKVLYSYHYVTTDRSMTEGSNS